MRIMLITITCAAIMISSAQIARGQELSQAGKNIRIQKLVRDVLGKNVTLNFKDDTRRNGKLTRANGSEFVLETDTAEEKFATFDIRSVTISPGISEGMLVLLSGVLVAGFGIGVATLSFEGISSAVQTAVAVVFGIFGGWLGYESFFQDSEIVLP